MSSMSKASLVALASKPLALVRAACRVSMKVPATGTWFEMSSGNIEMGMAVSSKMKAVS